MLSFLFPTVNTYPFGFLKNLQLTFLDNTCQGDTINLHIGATALHYGQACFEGLKAFAHEDGTVNIFRPDENAKRYVFSSVPLDCGIGHFCDELESLKCPTP